MAYSHISYPIILTWILKYFLASFNHILPWTTCNNTWNTENCYDYKSSGNKTFSVYSERNVSSDWNIDVHNNTNNKSLSASEEYLKYVVHSLIIDDDRKFLIKIFPSVSYCFFSMHTVSKTGQQKID